MVVKQALNEGLLNKGIKSLVEHQLVNKHCQQFMVTNLNVGSVNHNFHVSDRKRSVLFKLLSENDILPINRQAVFNMQTHLATKGIAPQPLYLSDDKAYYSEQWIPKSHTLLAEKLVLQKQLGRKEATLHLIPLLAQALIKIHQSSVDAPTLNLTNHLKTYWAHIASPSQALDKEYREILAFCDKYELENKNDYVFCHNDLNMDHVCLNSGVIFDWEYASYGSRYFDIASCALINQFDEDESRHLCDEYAKLNKQKPEIVYRAVQNVSKLTEFTYKLWHYTVGHEPIDE